jgi:Flp pilus assembly protein TadG
MKFDKHDEPAGQLKSGDLPSSQIIGKSRIISRITGLARGRQDGGAMVEFALVAPMMLALLTGIFGLGFALTDYLQLNNAVDVGARTIAVIRATNSDGTTPDPCAAALTAIKNAAPALNSSQIKLSFSLNGTSYPNVTTCTNGEANIIAGKTAQVSATYPYTLMLFGWKPVSMTLTAQTTELLQ